ncbi:hypothetical protein pb186bvf_016230 [Paramecium bursaria]
MFYYDIQIYIIFTLKDYYYFVNKASLFQQQQYIKFLSKKLQNQKKLYQNYSLQKKKMEQGVDEGQISDDQGEIELYQEEDVNYKLQKTQINIEHQQEQHIITHFLEIGEYVDYLHNNKWITMKIQDIQNSQLQIIQPDSGVQSWVSFDYETIRKQWINGVPLHYSRVDVQNPHIGWVEGIVIQIEKDKVLIHHSGYKKIYDCYYHSKDIQPLGYYTNNWGIGKYLKLNPQSITRLQHKYNHYFQIQSLITIRRKYKEMEITLHNVLSELGMFVKDVEGDGNCMFRAISDQLYGTQIYHKELRRYAMNYILQEKDYFQDYIINGDVEQYVEYKLKDGVWGDNIELQAFRELYDIPIEIYVCSKEPLKTGLENNPHNKEPIRLSYHGSAHYNSIKFKDKPNTALLENQHIGTVEDKIIERLKDNKNQFQKQINGQSTRAQFGNSISNELDVIFNESKKLFQDEQQVIQQSIESKEQEEEEEQLMDMVIKQSEQEIQNKDFETQILKQIMEQSKQEQENKIMQQFEDNQMQKAIKESENQFYDDPMNIPVIAQVMNMGCFMLENVLEAYAIYGNDAEMIINYLYD